MSLVCEYERIREGNIAERMEVFQMLDIDGAVAGVSGRLSCSKKPSEKTKRDGQSSHVVKVRPSRKERGRRGSLESSLEDEGEEVESHGRELTLKYWEGPLDHGTLKDIMDWKEDLEKEQQQQGLKGVQCYATRKLGVGFKVAGEVKAKALLIKRESKKSKMMACRKCESCRRENCGACNYCRDMKRFGGGECSSRRSS